MIDDLKQQISEFVLQISQIIPFDRIRNLISFLDGVGGNRRKRVDMGPVVRGRIDVVSFQTNFAAIYCSMR